jgi:hypothetical protein
MDGGGIESQSSTSKASCGAPPISHDSFFGTREVSASSQQQERVQQGQLRSVLFAAACLLQLH